MEPNALTRLKRVAGKQTTTLTHCGRKTGKPHEVTIWFVLDDDKLYIGTANVNRQWVRNVQKTPKIRLCADSCPTTRCTSATTAVNTGAGGLSVTGKRGNCYPGRAKPENPLTRPASIRSIPTSFPQC